MLTEKQIKNLKPGTSLVVQGTYVKQYCDGDIGMQFYITSEGKSISDMQYFHPTCVSLKYNLGRKFKKGDKVNITPRDGRYPVVLPMGCAWFGHNLVVVEDEEDDGLVQVLNEDGFRMSVAFFFLELVSSVEDQMPYSIDPADTNVLLKDGKKFATFEDNDEAQETRDRLNAEWIKEQNND